MFDGSDGWGNGTAWQQLAELARRIEGLLKPVENDFLVVGRELSGAVTVFGPLIDCFASLPDLLDNQDLRNSSASLASIAAEAATMAQSTQDEQGELKDLERLNAVVLDRIGHLRKTVGIISMLGFNAKIAVASVDDDDGSFASFISEIIRLSRGVVQTIETITATQGQLRDLITAAIERQAGFETTHRATLGVVAHDLEAALSVLTERNIDASRAASQIEERAGRNRARIETVVVGLQLSDNLSQRLSHVSRALLLLRDDAALAPWAYRLEAAQIERSARDLEEGLADIHGSLIALAADVGELVRSGDAIYGGDAPAPTFLDVLDAKLRITVQTMDAWFTARSALDEAVTAVGAMVGELSRQLSALQGIEVAMRLVGLNTMFKCSRLGDEGRTLRVIAQELRRYAHQTMTDGEALTQALSAVATASQRFATARSVQITDQGARLEQRMAEAITPFRAIGTGLAQALETLKRDGARVNSILSQMAERVERQRPLLGSLDQAKAALAAEAATGRAIAPDLAARLADFGHAHYTMAAEREVHEEIMAALGIATSAAPPAADAGDDLDDIFF